VCPWIPEGKLKTLGKQLVAVESTGVSMDMSKQQISPRIPQRYIYGRPHKKPEDRDFDSRVEAGSNTSTVDLRVVGEEKGTQCLGV
jgi:hypothetical protein